MTRSLTLRAAFVVPGRVMAHEGHAHKVMGTITAIDGNHVTVKTTDGKTGMVMLDDKTKVTQGQKTIQASALKVGDRYYDEHLMVHRLDGPTS